MEEVGGAGLRSGGGAALCDGGRYDDENDFGNKRATLS